MNYTVESRFFECPSEIKLGLKNLAVQEIGGKITVLQTEGRDMTFGSSYQEWFVKSKVPEVRIPLLSTV